MPKLSPPSSRALTLLDGVRSPCGCVFHRSVRENAEETRHEREERGSACGRPSKQGGTARAIWQFHGGVDDGVPHAVPVPARVARVARPALTRPRVPFVRRLPMLLGTGRGRTLPLHSPARLSLPRSQAAECSPRVRSHGMPPQRVPGRTAQGTFNGCEDPVDKRARRVNRACVQQCPVCACACRVHARLCVLVCICASADASMCGRRAPDGSAGAPTLVRCVCQSGVVVSRYSIVSARYKHSLHSSLCSVGSRICHLPR